MSEHGGQPQWAGWITFDVTELAVTEPGGITPGTIIPTNRDFILAVTFDGSGAIWDWLETMGVKYRVRFYAERIGYNSLDLPVIPATDEGILSGGPYRVEHTVPANTFEEGLWRLGVTVTFPPMTDSPGCPWAAGYFEGSVIEVYAGQ